MPKGAYYLAFHGAQFVHGVSLMEGHTVLWETPSLLDPKQNKPLIAWIDDAFNDSGITPADLQGVVTTRGPGSFTGLRNSLAIAEAFSLALKCPVIALNSFEWVYQALGFDRPLGVVLESRREEPFCALCDANGHLMKDPTFLPQKNFSAYFEDYPVFDSRHHPLPSVGSLVECALKLKAFDNSKLYPLIPLYIRMADVSQTKKLI
jgi:tRNA threonylcarbamoyl adenosine modification protein YeaZ